MPDAPRSIRRWFRFSLRTMLAAFTVLAVVFGYNLNLVRERRAFIESLPAPCFAGIQPEATTAKALDDLRGRAEIEALIALTDKSPPTDGPFGGWPVVPCHVAKPTADGVSWIRQLLGDKPYMVISYFPGPPIERAHELFPEAKVWVAKEPHPAHWRIDPRYGSRAATKH